MNKYDPTSHIEGLYRNICAGKTNTSGLSVFQAQLETPRGSISTEEGHWGQQRTSNPPPGPNMIWTMAWNVPLSIMHFGYGLLETHCYPVSIVVLPYIFLLCQIGLHLAVCRKTQWYTHAARVIFPNGPNIWPLPVVHYIGCVSDTSNIMYREWPYIWSVWKNNPGKYWKLYNVQ